MFVQIGEPIPSDHKQCFFLPPNYKISKSQILQMYLNGQITDRDLQLTKLLFRFPFATTHQLFLLFGGDWTEEAMEKRLHKISGQGYRLLNRFSLSTQSDSGPECFPEGALTIYCLDTGGQCLLSEHTNFDLSNWSTSSYLKSGGRVAKSLEALNFYIRLKQLFHTTPERLLDFQIGPVRYAKPEGANRNEVLIPSAEFVLKDIGASKFSYGIVEVINSDETLFEVQNKVARYAGLLSTRSWESQYPNAKAQPALFVIAHTLDDLKWIAPLYAAITGIHVLFTTPERLLTQPFVQGAFLMYSHESEIFTRPKLKVFEVMDT